MEKPGPKVSGCSVDINMLIDKQLEYSVITQLP